MTARIARHHLRQKQRLRRRERERARARKRVLGPGPDESAWVRLQATVSEGFARLGEAAHRLQANTGRRRGSTKRTAKSARTSGAKRTRASTATSRKSHPRAAQAARIPDSILLGLFSRLWPRRWWARIAMALAIFIAVVGGTVLLGTYVRYRQEAAAFDLRQIGRMPQESVVFDTYGTPFTRLHGDGRIVVPLDAVSPHFLDALIAREDTRFYSHDGVDLFGVARAVLRNTRDGEFAQGASTLTMQLARISFDLRDKTLHRKFVEAALAQRIESHYSKQDILFYYVNRVFLGSGLYGVEAAARAHFGKTARDLTLGESAMLVGVIRAPNRFSPFRHYEAALAERDTVLGRMVELGMIEEAQAEAARAEPIRVLPQDQVSPADLRPVSGGSFPVGSHSPGHRPDSYLTRAVRSEVEALLNDEQQASGGLDIYTTFDLTLQDAAEQAIEQRLQAIEATPGYPHPIRVPGSGRSDYLQAAAMVIDNGLGAVRAMVGGRSFEESRFNRATQARRQAGSIFKPLIYAIAFEYGLFPGTLVDDRPIRDGEIPWDPNGWSPRNADGSYQGWMTAETGLVSSRNTMTVRVGEVAGIAAVTEMARHAGLEDPTLSAGGQPSPQIYIGNLGASLMALTSAYTAFANEGYRATPYFIERIEDRRGNILYQRQPEGYRVVSAGATWLTSRILEKVMGPGGTGRSARDLGIDFPVAGKTGTTNDYRDAWFVGYSSSLSCGVWVGLDQPERIVDRGYGSRLALPIWSDIMLATRDLRYPTMALPEAEQAMTIELCNRSGLLASDTCRQHGNAYHEQAPQSMIPRQTCRDCSHGPGGGAPTSVRPTDSGNSEDDAPTTSDSWFDRLKRLLSVR